MARVKLNPALASFVGQVGDFVFKMRHGKIYAARMPDAASSQQSDAQQAVRKRFRLATAYARMVMGDPEAREHYDLAAKARQLPVQNVIIADFLTAPSVDKIDVRQYHGRPGDAISVTVHDDFDVSGVNVSISGDEGRIIEQGPAAVVSMNWGLWIYTSTASVPPGTQVRVEAVVRDRPGNTGVKSEDMMV